jgi:hypothetical protein
MYIVQTHADKEFLWLWIILGELRVVAVLCNHGHSQL